MTDSLALPRRRWGWVAIPVVLVLGAGAGLGYAALRSEGDCGAEKVAARSPLLDPDGMDEQPDARLDTLRDAVEEMGPPFGEVRAGVGYDYDQWLRLYGVPGGLLAWTKNNAPVTMLDEELRPRWSLRPLSKRTAWDASADRFVLLDLEADEATQVATYALSSGAEKWCVRLTPRHEDGDPVGSAFLDDGDLLVLLPGKKTLSATRLADADGHERWERDLVGPDRGDFLAQLDSERFVVGGVEEYRLAEPNPSAAPGPAVSAYSLEDGRRIWSWTPPAANTLSHVVGADERRIVVVSRSAEGVRLVGLTHEGAEAWSSTPDDAAFEATMRGGVVVMRSQVGLDGYSVETGELLWHKPTPTDETYFPYGFTLSQMPSLDQTHVLMPTTTSLRVLDVITGEDVGYDLPVDGISTTYWPYQLAVTPGLIGVVTNTGGVVAARE